MRRGTPAVMNPTTARLLEKLVRQQRWVLDRARKEPPNSWVFRPAPSAWGAAEVFDHLVRVEREYAAGLRAGLSEPRRGPATVERLRAWAVIGVMHSPMRVAMPSAVADLIRPTAAASFEECAQAWTAAREELAAIVQTAKSDARAGVLRHPVCGWITLNDALRVLYAHTHHHEFQLKRLRRKAREMAVQAS